MKNKCFPLVLRLLCLGLLCPGLLCLTLLTLNGCSSKVPEDPAIERLHQAIEALATTCNLPLFTMFGKADEEYANANIEAYFSVSFILEVDVLDAQGKSLLKISRKGNGSRRWRRKFAVKKEGKSIGSIAITYCFQKNWALVNDPDILFIGKVIPEVLVWHLDEEPDSYQAKITLSFLKNLLNYPRIEYVWIEYNNEKLVAVDSGRRSPADTKLFVIKNPYTKEGFHLGIRYAVKRKKLWMERKTMKITEWKY